MYKKNINLLTIVLLLIFMCSNVLSLSAESTKNVTGKIVDQHGLSVIGATIVELNTTNGVTADLDGVFNIKVSSLNASLHITCIGMDPQTIELNGRNTLNIVLKDASLKIDEVVVTALGIKREAKALGYAIASVDSDVLSAGKEQNIMSAISGKVAGVDITTTAGGPSGSTRVLIRGNSQLSGSNQPLYVIDGMPVDNTEFAGAGKEGGYDYGDVLSSINPDDIESISVLKGPSASALYGSQASNGVILITTKSAGVKKGIGVQFSSNASVVSLLSSFDDYQRQYGQGTRGAIPITLEQAQRTTQKAWGAKLDPTQMATIFNGQQKPYGNVDDNVLSFFRTGVTINNSIAFTNRMDKGSFRLSISDLRNQDIIPGSEMNRTTFMFKGDTRLGKKLTISAQVNYSLEKVLNRPALSNSGNNIGNSIIGIAPSVHQSWLADGYKDEYGRYINWNSNDNRISPYWILNEMENETNKSRFTGKVAFNWSIIKGLRLTGSAGTDRYTLKISDYANLDTPKRLTGGYTTIVNDVLKNNFELLLRYNRKFGDFQVSGFAGGNLMQYKFDSGQTVGTDQVIPDLIDITNYKSKMISHTLNKKEVRSLFASASLGYKNYAYLDATLRNDISSTLSPENRSYLYPSVSGSFIFTEFFKLKSPILSFGKIRASWAKVGGDTSPYQLSLQYALKDYTINGIPLGEISNSKSPNYNLKPTSTYSYEAGIDLRFFNGRLTLDATYYKQETIDQILALPVSSTTGYEDVLINAGKLTNQGVEISLSGTPVERREFSWVASLNFARNINNVEELHPEIENYELAAARWANAFIYAQAGQAYGVIVGKKMQRTEAGEIIYKNGLPLYDEEISVLGNGTSKFTLGFNNEFSYKNFRLTALIDMKFGADVYSMSNMLSHVNGTSENTLEGREGWYASEASREEEGKELDNWVTTGGYLGEGVMEITNREGETEYVKNDVYVDPQDYWNSIYQNSPEPFIYDASYIKLREVSLSYTFTPKMLRKTPLQSVSLSAYGRNLFTIYSNIPNIDPESSYSSGNGQGFEYGALPSRRTFGFGLNITF